MHDDAILHTDKARTFVSNGHISSFTFYWISLRQIIELQLYFGVRLQLPLSLLFQRLVFVHLERTYEGLSKNSWTF